MTYEQVGAYVELMGNAQGNIPAIWLVGNHDDAPYQSSENRLTRKEVYSLFGKKSKESGAVVPEGCNYGYLDLEEHKLRVIFLDTDEKYNRGTLTAGLGEPAPEYVNAHDLSTAQLLWLADTALDFSGKEQIQEWGIVLVSHVGLDVSGEAIDAVSGAEYRYSTKNAAQILAAYKQGESGKLVHNGEAVDYDFSGEKRAGIICAVHGHNHKFCSGILEGNILSIGCPNIMNGRESTSDDGMKYTKVPGTARGTSFCIITVDRENHMVYADCAGAGYNRAFSIKNGI